jgi:hypothetical protein
LVTNGAANTTVQIFLPVARFAGHVVASAVAFVALAIVALIPLYLVKILVMGGRLRLTRRAVHLA